MEENIEGFRSGRDPPDDSPLGDDAAELDPLNRGNVLAARGDYEGAAASYGDAMGAGDPDRSSLAAIYLADLLEGPFDDGYAALAAYDEAADANHPDWRPTARLLQGSLLERIGDTEGARTAYQSVIKSAPGTRSCSRALPGESPERTAGLARRRLSLLQRWWLFG